MLSAVQNAIDTVDPLIGCTLGGRYRLLRMIGEGGMGRIYQAQHLLIDRAVAVKVLREDYCRRADVLERFRREAKSASRIGHPNIVDVLDFGETKSGASYFVMEMLAGKELAQVIADERVLMPERAVRIAYQCCHALALAHDKGIVHRDMKPENILLIERDGFGDFVKIVDFGVAKMSDPEFEMEDGSHAKLTRTGMIFGTPEYMSPEQAIGLPPDFRVDIYAMGVTLYELLTGRVPFEGNTFMAVLSKHANCAVPEMRALKPDLHVSPALEAVVMRALRKERGERFTSMREMAQALQQVPEMVPLPFRLSLPNGAALSHSPFDAQPDDASLVPNVAPVRHLRSGRRVMQAVSALALLSALSAALYFLTVPQALTLEPTAAAAQPGAWVPAAVTAQAPLPVAQAQEPERVTIRVTTQPTGARVQTADGMQVCTTTPCTFDVIQDAPLALRARHGRREARTTLTPTAATDVHLVLQARPQRRRLAASPTGGEELKTPAIFR